MLLPAYFSPCINDLFYLLQFERVVQFNPYRTNVENRVSS